MNSPLEQMASEITRRYFLGQSTTGLGAMALASLLPSELTAEKSGHSGSSASATTDSTTTGSAKRKRPRGVTRPPHFAPKAKRIIYLFQSGGPSHIELFDYKPGLKKYAGQEVPKSVYPDDRKTTMTSAQSAFLVAPPQFKFQQHGKSGAWLSELLPHTAKIADELCIVRSMFTEAINHDPAITFFQTGSQIAGRPSIGSWLTYGLGCEAADLPAFVAMSSRGTGRPAGQPLYDRLWGSGFLPSHYQGVKFRNQGAAVLDVRNPVGVDRKTRREMLNGLAEMNRLKFEKTGDPEILTRIKQYELAYQMQMSVPELLDFKSESKKTLAAYGPAVQKQGSYAYNCLMARRLIERGVRFVQLFHQGWDQHQDLKKQLPLQCKDVDQSSAALVMDLKQRGLLDDTLVVWGGEFGRTVYSQAKAKKKGANGRDHHPSCFSIWMAGGGIRPGMTYGKTDDYSTNIVEKKVHVHDLHATMLHLMGLDHKRLTYPFQGRDFRLTDVHGEVVKPLLG